MQKEEARARSADSGRVSTNARAVSIEARARNGATSARRSCFDWLAGERRDALLERGIASPNDETMAELVSFLKGKLP